MIGETAFVNVLVVVLYLGPKKAGSTAVIGDFDVEERAECEKQNEFRACVPTASGFAEE